VTAVAAGLLAPAGARAAGETITDVRILDNQRTDESTVRSLAGVSIGDTMELDTLEKVRERLNTAGLFSDVNVWWEQHGEGVRVNVAVKDKFPWAPVPTASWSANNRSFGLVFVHGNLFGRGKQMLAGGRIADVDSGATLAYRDPSLFGSWLYWQLQGFVQRQVIPEYNSDFDYPLHPDRETRMSSYGFEPVLGIAWFRRVRTQVGWQVQKVNVSGSDQPEFDGMPQQPYMGPPAAQSALVSVGRAVLSFDFRAREFAVMTGTALGASVDLASPSFGSDLEYWKVGASFERGVRFFKSHNLIYSVYGAFGHNLPFWSEYTAGGPNLRGYLFQQFRGDSIGAGKVEYHFPLFSIGSLDFRALGFYDVAAVWFRDLPPDIDVGDGSHTRLTLDRRNYLPSAQAGFSSKRDIHNSVGGGLRFFLRSVAIPLVGFDAGYGIEAGHWRFILILGA
jgi:outer membrane protein assembly factor BamA